jgi:hypothetical protein
LVESSLTKGERNTTNHGIASLILLAFTLFSANVLLQAAPSAASEGFRPRPTHAPTKTPTPLPPIPTPTPLSQPVFWSVVAGPILPGQGSELRGIAGSAANDLWAVGTYTDNNYARHTLAIHWNGNTWHAPSGFTGQNLFRIDTDSVDLWSAGTNPGMYISEGGYEPAVPNAQWLN